MALHARKKQKQPFGNEVGTHTHVQTGTQAHTCTHTPLVLSQTKSSSSWTISSFSPEVNSNNDGNNNRNNVYAINYVILRTSCNRCCVVPISQMGLGSRRLGDTAARQ